VVFLITGGAGFIGSHACVEFLNAGHEIVVVDNFSNSSELSLKRVGEITGRDFPIVHADVGDKRAMEAVFQRFHIQAVVHFAGLKAVGESVQHSLKYYENNVVGTLNLLKVMSDFDIKNIVFSSSATVYGEAKSMPIKEDAPLSATNPYGRTKLMIEEILHDIHVSDHDWRIVILRYFNPTGAHESGLIGEDPNGTPNNLMPYVAQVAAGRLEYLRVFGNDYSTPDGTGIRDYIHVVDLAEGHLAAVNYLLNTPGIIRINLGTGRGHSVIDIVDTFSKISGKPVPYSFFPRRSGDVAINFADPGLAKIKLGWTAKRCLERMCQDTWKWQQTNPYGYRSTM
jgi:UDP-glucose 4-epimerase